MGEIIGYARTSTADQVAGLEAQIRDLKAAGCETIYQEHASSVFNCPERDAVLAYLRKGDVFVITKIDRLARNAKHLLEMCEGIQAKGVTLRILALGIDTTTPMGKFALTIFAAAAEMERTNMLERQREGIAKARAAGKYKGRAPTARGKSADVLQLHSEGVGASEIARRVGIGRASVYRILDDAADADPPYGRKRPKSMSPAPSIQPAMLLAGAIAAEKPADYPDIGGHEND